MPYAKKRIYLFFSVVVLGHFFFLVSWPVRDQVVTGAGPSRRRDFNGEQSSIEKLEIVVTLMSRAGTFPMPLCSADAGSR